MFSGLAEILVSVAVFGCFMSWIAIMAIVTRHRGGIE